MGLPSLPLRWRFGRARGWLAAGPVINYDMLLTINSVEGLRSSDYQYDTSVKSHDNFMKLITKLVEPPGGRPLSARTRKKEHREAKQRINTRLGSTRTARSAVGEPEAAAADMLALEKAAAMRAETKARHTRGHGLFDARVWEILQQPYYRRTPDDIGRVSKFLAQHFPKLKEALRTSKMLAGLVELARFETLCGAGYKVPGDFMAEKFAIVLTGMVEVTRDNGFKVLIDSGGCFGAKDPFIACVEAVAMEPAELLVFTNTVAASVDETIKAEQSRKKSDALFPHFPEFLRWPREAIRPILGQMRWKRVPANTWLTRQGSMASSLAFIVEGECDVIRRIELDDGAGAAGAGKAKSFAASRTHPAHQHDEAEIGGSGAALTEAQAAGAASRKAKAPKKGSMIDTGGTARRHQPVRATLGQLTKGHYFGENCGLNLKIPGWEFSRPTAVPELFSVYTRTAVTLVTLSPEDSHNIEPYFALQFFLKPNPHRFGDLSKDELEQAFVADQGRQSWRDFKKEIMALMHLATAKPDVANPRSSDKLTPPSEFTGLTAVPKETPKARAAADELKTVQKRALGSCGFESNFGMLPGPMPGATREADP